MYTDVFELIFFTTFSEKNLSTSPLFYKISLYAQERDSERLKNILGQEDVIYSTSVIRQTPKKNILSVCSQLTGFN